MKLYQHQEFILEKSKDQRSFALFLETGTGKTIITIENIKYLWKKLCINFVIVLAPKMVIESVWEAELAKYYIEFHFRIFKWVGVINQTDKYIISDIIMKTHQQSWQILPILLINTEAFSHAKIYKLVTEILQKTKCMMVIDESTNIKNVRAARTKGILKLSHLPHYKRILSGFPILRSPEDLFSQVRFLGRDLLPYQSFYAFRNEFCVLRHMGKFSMVMSHKNLNKLAEQIKPFSIRILKKDCLDLPDKIRTKRYVEMIGEQRDMYEQMKKQAYIQLKNCDEKVFASSLLVQIGKLHQIANGILIQQEVEISNGKGDVLMEIIENEINGQVAIWSFYEKPLLQIEKRLKAKYNNQIVSIATNVNYEQRLKNLKIFQDKHARFLLASSASVHGLNLTNCCFSINLNNSTNLEHRIQWEDRFHRIGQVNKVTYIDLITHGTVEEKILKQLQMHHKIGAEVLKDEWEEWFK